MPESDKVGAIRALLPATAAGIYLNAGSCGPLPAETQRAMDEQSAHELTVGRAKIESFIAFMDRMAEARASVAAALVADPDDIALTHSTTDGINLVLGAVRWREGDRVVTTSQEHPGVLGPLQVLRERVGLEVEVVDIGDGGDDARTLDGIRAALERPARAVVASHALWSTGAVLPVAAIGALAREAGALAVIDGAQSAGAIPVTLEDLGVDAYAVPAQKWFLGPEGMGALWVRREVADATIPAVAAYPSFSAWDYAGGTGGTLRPGARRFEATGYHRPSVIGFARSLGWLSMFVGLPWAIERANRLARGMRARLASIDGVEMVSPANHGTLLTFRIRGWTPAEAVEELGARVFAIVRDLPINALRISVGFWSTEEELERFAAAVELLAAHTPDTIPARRTLAVLGSDGRPLE